MSIIYISGAREFFPLFCLYQDTSGPRFCQMSSLYHDRNMRAHLALLTETFNSREWDQEKKGERG